MSMIDRYKKKGGFLQLLNLLETTGGEKREKFLKMIAEENPAWEIELKKKMLTIERICSWNASYLMEIFPHVPVNNLALVISALPPDKQQIFIGAMAFQDRKKVEDFLSDKAHSPGEVNSSMMKLITEIRLMVSMGNLKFEKFDPDLVIPENIEEQLASGKVGLLPKDLDAVAPAHGTTTAGSDELLQLRRRIVQLTQENQRLSAENSAMKEKLEQIRKIA